MNDKVLLFFGKSNIMSEPLACSSKESRKISLDIKIETNEGNISIGSNNKNEDITSKPRSSLTQKLLKELLCKFEILSENINNRLELIERKLEIEINEIEHIKQYIIKNQELKRRDIKYKQQDIIEILMSKPPPNELIDYFLDNINVSIEDLNIIYERNIVFAIAKIIQRYNPEQIYISQFKPYTICIFDAPNQWKFATYEALNNIFSKIQIKLCNLYLKDLSRRNAESSLIKDNKNNEDNENESYDDNKENKELEEQLDMELYKVSKINAYKYKQERLITDFKRLIIEFANQ